MSQSNGSEKDINDIREDKNTPDFLVAGIGASAGGITALKDFFSKVPYNSGIAYVVILHLSPNHDSKLTQVLQPVTTMPVMQVMDSADLKPDHVYVISPNRSLKVTDTTILASTVQSVEERRAPVDILLRSLAESLKSRAVAIILSGTGANGSMGIKSIKEYGGVIFVQNPREAEFNEMPRNSIATDLVDAILPVAQIPERLMAYRDNRGKAEESMEIQSWVEEQEEALRGILNQLRIRTGHDFTNYKKATVLRRIERRISVRGLPGLTSYAAYIRDEKEESQALLKDLLISVTNFFRNKESFEYFEKDILPKLLADKTREDHIRIWVAGCATGEEAYSIAMLFAERFADMNDAPLVQIFATDIDEQAIAVARDGIYTLNDAADVSPERLRRFFVKEGDDYRVKREIREMILFAHHNVIKDAPFSRLDLVTCRNMLIYLNQMAQQRVIKTFHFALNPGGYLFIGSSENIDGSNDLYSTVSKDHHIFQTRKAVARSYPVPDTSSALRFDSNIPREIIQKREKRNGERMTFGDLHQRLLEEYAPPSVVVNEDFEIVHLSANAGRYMQMGGGEPSKNLLNVVREDLRLELRSLLYQAIKRQANVQSPNLPIRIDDHLISINLHVKPVLRDTEVARGFLLVLFEQVDEIPALGAVITSPDPISIHLEDELVRSKSQLRSAVEQYEVQAEELKASNEELQAMNEELRSAAEELETSKEELQSINEELITVNQELKVKIEELSQSNDDWQNLINATDIGTIFLDRNFRINLFTPAAKQLFNLIPYDIGRPLSDISHKLLDVNVLADAEMVIDQSQKIQREVATVDGRVFMMQLLPYRTIKDRVMGLVLTFVNITKLKHAENALRENEGRQTFLLELGDHLRSLINPRDIIYDALGALARRLDVATASYTDLDEKMEWACSDLLRSDAPVKNYSERIPFNVNDKSVLALSAGNSLIVEDKPIGKWPLIPSTLPPEALADIKTFLHIPVIKDDRLHAFLSIADTKARRWSEADIVLGREVAARTHTALQRTNSEQKLRQSVEHLHTVMESVADFAIIITDPEGVITGWNPGAQKMFGYAPEEIVGQTMEPIFTPEDRKVKAHELEIKTAAKLGRAEDERWHLRKDGTRFYVSGVMNRLRQGSDGFVKIARDMTTQKIMEQQKDEFIGIASHELKTPVTSIKAYAEMLQDMFIDAKDLYSAELMGKLDKQIDRLTTLMRDLLDTTKISEGQLILQPDNFDLNELIIERVEDMRQVSPKHKIILKLEKLRMLTADRERIGQVVTNLISNAVKYSPNNEEIIITSGETENGVRVCVRDRGIGMSIDTKDRVFNRFYRSNNPKVQTFPGLGLGLYIASEIVKRHGGSMDIESNEGEGSMFCFSLPAARDEE
ncbi:MAG TPA: CheR family methyltransferase [Chitinophagaceae bacterium]|nr:CheR family methyltransferase [Chitinophagaceae bacterium]